MTSIMSWDSYYQHEQGDEVKPPAGPKEASLPHSVLLGNPVFTDTVLDNMGRDSVVMEEVRGYGLT